jgi:cell division protein ZapA (FtsZ GTPase activity inhibitor)
MAENKVGTKTEMKESKSTWNRNRLLIIAAVVVGIFLSGFLPMYLQKRGLEQTLAQTNQEMEVTLKAASEQAQRLQQREGLVSLHSEFGMVLVEVEQYNFGTARERATKFFDSLGRAIASEDMTEGREQLAKILNRRDEIISDLASPNPSIIPKLRSLYTEMYGIIHSETR